MKKYLLFVTLILGLSSCDMIKSKLDGLIGSKPHAVEATEAENDEDEFEESQAAAPEFSIAGFTPGSYHMDGDFLFGTDRWPVEIWFTVVDNDVCPVTDVRYRNKTAGTSLNLSWDSSKGDSNTLAFIGREGSKAFTITATYDGSSTLHGESAWGETVTPCEFFKE